MRHKNNKNVSKNQKTGLVSMKNYVIWAVLVLFVTGTVFFTIQTATSGARLAKLEQEEADLIKENQKYSNQLIELTSLTSVKESAEDLGFGKPERVIYLTEEEAVAKLP